MRRGLPGCDDPFRSVGGRAGLLRRSALATVSAGFHLRPAWPVRSRLREIARGIRRYRIVRFRRRWKRRRACLRVHCREVRVPGPIRTEHLPTWAMPIVQNHRPFHGPCHLRDPLPPQQEVSAARPWLPVPHRRIVPRGRTRCGRSVPSRAIPGYRNSR